MNEAAQHFRLTKLVGCRASRVSSDCWIAVLMISSGNIHS